MVTKGERGWEFGINIYTLLHIKQMINKDLYIHTYIYTHTYIYIHIYIHTLNYVYIKT